MGTEINFYLGSKDGKKGSLALQEFFSSMDREYVVRVKDQSQVR
jgi:hypothetical protein